MIEVLPPDLSGCRRMATAVDPAYRLRLPEPMFVHLQDVAAANGRSLNTEILYRLLDSLGVPDG